MMSWNRQVINFDERVVIPQTSNKCPKVLFEQPDKCILDIKSKVISSDLAPSKTDNAIRIRYIGIIQMLPCVHCSIMSKERYPTGICSQDIPIGINFRNVLATVTLLLRTKNREILFRCTKSFLFAYFRIYHEHTFLKSRKSSK